MLRTRHARNGFPDAVVVVTPPRRFLHLQDHLAALLGCEPAARPAVVAGMLRRSPAEATGYWLQLVVSVGIATLGLVLESTAVVIGAMLIAPLMSPIVSFGMGLAVGSPFLVLRHGLRIIVSIGLAIGCSALLTRILPFHQMNAEIAARTAPTVLDLLTAAFCAIAGVYASMRPGSDVAATAAGTSIGISLVPPLCASGYGIGTGAWSIAGGAALLFLTNFVAIAVVGTLAFAAAGFHQVDIVALESEQPSNHGARTARGTAGWLRRIFASRGGPWLRLLMPVVLLAAVYVPLRRALDEVAWQIRVRGEVEAALGRLPARIVESRTRVERGEVDIALVLVGTAADAERSRARLDAELRDATGVTPRIEMLAVPDAAAFAGLEASLRTRRLPEPAPPSASAQLEDALGLVRTAVERRWPRQTAGRAISVAVTIAGEEVQLHVVHLGSPLDVSARETLERTLKDDLHRPVRLFDVAFPREAVRPADTESASLVELAALIERSKHADAVWICVTEPREADVRRRRREAARNREALDELLQGHPRVVRQEGETWSLSFASDRCPNKAKATSTE